MKKILAHISDKDLRELIEVKTFDSFELANSVLGGIGRTAINNNKEVNDNEIHPIHTTLFYLNTNSNGKKLSEILVAKNIQSLGDFIFKNYDYDNDNSISDLDVYFGRIDEPELRNSHDALFVKSLIGELISLKAYKPISGNTVNKDESLLIDTLYLTNPDKLQTSLIQIHASSALSDIISLKYIISRENFKSIGQKISDGQFFVNTYDDKQNIFRFDSSKNELKPMITSNFDTIVGNFNSTLGRFNHNGVKTRLKKNIITRVDNELIVNTMNDVNFCYDEKVKFTIHPKLTNEELLNDTFYASKNGCLVLLKIDQMLSNIEELKLNKGILSTSDTYRNFDPTLPGLGKNEFVVRKGKKGIVKITKDKIKCIHPCGFDEIFQYDGTNKIIYAYFEYYGEESIYSGKYLVSYKDDKYYKVFTEPFSDILHYWKLPSGMFQAVVQSEYRGELLGTFIVESRGGEIANKLLYEIVHSDIHGIQNSPLRARKIRSEKEWEHLGSMKIHEFIQYLHSEEYPSIGHEWKKLCTIEITNGGLKELLPCIYDTIGPLGDPEYGLKPDEAIVSNGRKIGIVKKDSEVLPCNYKKIGLFGDPSLSLNPDEAMVEESEGKIGMIRRNNDGTFTEIIDPIYDKLLGRNLANILEDETWGVLMEGTILPDYSKREYTVNELLKRSVEKNKFINTGIKYYGSIDYFKGFNFNLQGLSKGFSFLDISEHTVSGLIKKDGENYTQVYEINELCIDKEDIINTHLGEGVFLRVDGNTEYLSFISFSDNGEIIPLSNEYQMICGGIQGSDLFFAFNKSDEWEYRYDMYILKKSENEFYDELVSSSILEFDGIENIRQSLEYFHITKIDGKQFIVYYESNRDIMPTLITENSDGVLAILPLDKTITFLKENQKHFNEIKERVGTPNKDTLMCEIINIDYVLQGYQLNNAKEYYELLGFGKITDEEI